MLTPKDVARLVLDLKEAKVLNTDATLEQMVQAVAKSPNLTPTADAASGDATVAWYVAGGSGFVIVIPS